MFLKSSVSLKQEIKYNRIIDFIRILYTVYDSKNKDYYSFSHWSDCLKGYKDYVQYKWNGNGDYYLFLQNLPYAEDPNYIKKVKYLVNNK